MAICSDVMRYVSFITFQGQIFIHLTFFLAIKQIRYCFIEGRYGDAAVYIKQYSKVLYQ